MVKMIEKLKCLCFEANFSIYGRSNFVDFLEKKVRFLDIQEWNDKKCWNFLYYCENHYFYQKNSKSYLWGFWRYFFSKNLENEKFFIDLKFLYMGSSALFSKKKWKINIFYMVLEFLHMGISTLFSIKIRKMKIYCNSCESSIL